MNVVGVVWSHRECVQCTLYGTVFVCVMDNPPSLKAVAQNLVRMVHTSVTSVCVQGLERLVLKNERQAQSTTCLHLYMFACIDMWYVYIHSVHNYIHIYLHNWQNGR